MLWGLLFTFCLATYRPCKAPDSTPINIREPLSAGGHLLIASEVELAEKAAPAGVKEEEGAATPGPAKVAKPDGASTPGAAKQVIMHQNAAEMWAF